LARDFDAVIDMAEKCHVQKKLIKELEFLKQQFKGNIPFIAESFSEQLTKTVTEAKGEVDAFVDAKLKHAGLEKLIGEAPYLALPEAKEKP
jgi:hypothetical protein